ncbi:hypothetical protein GQ457_14G016020 [Hibiscus cannabinus]
MTKAHFNGKGERASDLLGLIHSDVCGPMNTQARGGFQYFITFTDDFSRYGCIYLMHHKSEALEKFKEFKNEVQNQHGKSIKTLRPDRGGEYLSQDFDELLKECGIVSQLTPPGTPQWNGVSERRNRTLLDMVRSMMSHTDLPTSFWGYALETSAFTLNRVPSKSVQKTPHEMWTGKRPNMSFMKVWGCKAYVKHQMSTKLEPISQKCTFVGYPKETKGYYFYNENKVFVARTGVFLEKEFLSNKGKDQDEPKTYQEAVASPDSEKWLEAMRSEMDSIGCKWVFTKKTDMDGNVQTYKGRLVAKGFRIFSPVAVFKSIRILLAVVAFHDYEIWQMDVKTAFLNGKLEEDVYMTQREGFVTPKNVGKGWLQQVVWVCAKVLPPQVLQFLHYQPPPLVLLGYLLVIFPSFFVWVETGAVGLHQEVLVRNWQSRIQVVLWEYREIEGALWQHFIKVGFDDLIPLLDIVRVVAEICPQPFKLISRVFCLCV